MKNYLEVAQNQRKITFLNFLCQAVLWNQDIPNIIQSTTFVFKNIQYIAILIWIQLNAVTRVNTDDFTFTIKELSRMVIFQDIFDYSENKTAVIIISVILGLYMLCFLIALGLIIRSFWLNSTLSKNKDYFIMLLGQMHLSIGFWFVNAFLMQYLDLKIISQGFSSLNGAEFTLSILSILFLILSYIFAFFFASISYDPFMSNNLLSCHTPIFQIASLIFKAIIAPILYLANDSTGKAWTLVLLSLGIFLVRMYALLSNFPFYQYLAMKICIFFGSSQLLISFLNFLALAVKDTKYLRSKELVFADLMLLPLLYSLATHYLNQQIFSSLALENKKIKKFEQVIKKVFAISYLMKRAKLTINNKLQNDISELRFWGALAQFKQVQIAKFTSEGALDDLELEQTENRYFVGEMCEYFTMRGERMIRVLLQESADKFKQKGQLKAIFAHFALTHKLPFLLSIYHLGEMAKIQGRAKFMAMRLYKKLQQSVDQFFFENKGKVLDLKQYIELEDISNEFVKLVMVNARGYSAYWAKYSKPTLEIKEFLEKSKELEHGSDYIEGIWKRYADANKNFTNSLCNIYSLYLSLLRGSPLHAQKILQRYKPTNEHMFGGMDHDAVLNDDSLTSSNVLSMYTSMTKESPGKILKVSNNFTDITGWQVTDVIGHTPNLLMPSFMAQTHDRVLQDHLKSLHDGKVSRMYQTIQTFILLKSGSIVPCEIYISVHPYVQEVPMYIVIVRVKEVQFDQILISENGTVEGFTKTIGDMLGLNAHRKVNMKNLCQDFDEVEMAMHGVVDLYKPKIEAEKTDENVEFELPPLKSFASSTPLRLRTDSSSKKTTIFRALKEKIIMETAENVNQTFTLYFSVSDKYQRAQGSDIIKCSVELKPNVFDDICYFILNLKQEMLGGDELYSRPFKSQETGLTAQFTEIGGTDVGSPKNREEVEEDESVPTICEERIYESNINDTFAPFPHDPSHQQSQQTQQTLTLETYSPLVSGTFKRKGSMKTSLVQNQNQYRRTTVHEDSDDGRIITGASIIMKPTDPDNLPTITVGGTRSSLIQPQRVPTQEQQQQQSGGRRQSRGRSSTFLKKTLIPGEHTTAVSVISPRNMKNLQIATNPIHQSALESSNLSPGRGDTILLSPAGSHKPLVPVQSESSREMAKVIGKKKAVVLADLDAMASSSMGSTFKNQIEKIEQAVSFIPKDPKIDKFHIASLLLIALAGIPLIIFLFQSNSTVNLVQGSVEVISKSIFRLVRITDMGRYVRNVWQANDGIYQATRYSSYGYTGTAEDILKDQIDEVINDLNSRNNQLRSFLNNLDSGLQKSIYSEVFPVYEMQSDSSISSTRTSNLFDVITELVSHGTQFLTSSIPPGNTNPHMFFCLKNTFNSPLVHGEDTIPVLIDDNSSKLQSLATFTYIMMGLIALSGVFVLLYFLSIIAKFVRERDLFLNLFVGFDERSIFEHLGKVDEFISTLEHRNFDMQKIQVKQNAENYSPYYSKVKATKTAKKSIDTKGIAKILYMFYIGIFALVVLLFLAYPILLAQVNIGNNQITTKMELMTESGLNQYNMNFLFATIYEYIQESGNDVTTRDKPINEDWESTYQAMTNVQDFIIRRLLNPDNGLEAGGQLYNLAMGNLCTKISTNDTLLAQLCPRLGGGVVMKGLVGLNSYTLSTLREVKDFWDNSLKTPTDMAAVLSGEGLVNIEIFYPFTYQVYTTLDDMIRAQISKDFEKLKNVILQIIVAFLVIYLVLGIMITRKIRMTLQKEMSDWRKMLRQIPYVIVTENKHLRLYIQKTSDGILGAGRS